MEFAFDHGALRLARGASFFQHQIVAAPGSRLAFDDVWAAFQAWCRSHRFQGQIGADDFAASCDLLSKKHRRPCARQPGLLLGRSVAREVN
jgi:hypothetical protein